MNVVGRTIVVVGLGESGRAASAFLARRGARVIAMDLKREEELARARQELAALRALGVQVVLGAHPPELVRAADAIVVSPGVPPTLAVLDDARRAGVPILGEVELAARFLRGILIGVTGTNGKTTVTAWIGDLLARCGYCAHVGGNIGRALVRVLDQVHDERCCVVAELSSFQLETAETLHPRVAVVTNIAPDHLDRHGSLQAYIEAKRRIFRNQTEADWAVLNADDPVVRAMADATRARVLIFSRREGEPSASGVFLRGDRIVLRWEGEERELAHRADIPLRGAHNVENALAALAATLAGASLVRATDQLLSIAESLPVREAVRAFPGVEHRLEWVARIEGVDYYNDSKATNVASTLTALEALAGPIVLILGGRDKGDDFGRLRPLVAEKVAHVLVLGEAAEKIRAALGDIVPVTRCATLEEAVQTARRLAPAGGAVLLSPACASFDMFENFEHRGCVFKEAVRRISLHKPGREENGC
jgi:UDP-N-acetylmuramoylalanine--D-glutamate ligase